MPFKSILFSILTAFSVSTAFAADAAGGHASKGSFLGMLPMLIIFVVVFYFLLVRPQSKRAKQQKALLSGMQVGDEVITAGGLVGTLSKIDEQFVELKLADNLTIKMQKSSVSSILPKGSAAGNNKSQAEIK